MTAARKIGVLGGTFDPIHFGHLRTAFELLQALRLDEMRFMPAGNPPHRDVTVASAEIRLAMVRAATEGQPGFIVDDREVRRDLWVGVTESATGQPPADSADLRTGVESGRLTLHSTPGRPLHWPQDDLPAA